ncbi:outer membrane protein assembly factor BamA [Roseivivax sp. GX 12232]|uniref:outer membrane protein assembly factor BamA n=1 Tax=Roseivivax sp. GX 12232 TaxID=2900547 RepID=UPI001E517ADC|nr:outer membrane protein assembly factor BamA [Roseivivax sp. GX 12232]MCE0504936.1 outer membrane protein assembly factor BamA [Roseivivax sp. GX 12232]
MSITTNARCFGVALSELARTSTVALFALTASTAMVAVPQVAVAQSFVFNSVQIEGAQRIESGTILSYAGIPRGEPVSAAQLNSAFQNLQNSGLFESVEIVPQGSTLVIRVVEYPTINRIAIEGNRRIDDEDLQPILQSQSRRVYSPTTAEADANTIADAYLEQGRIAARVQPRVIRRSDNRVDLVFEVFEGGVAEVERIAFVGNQTYSDRRLRRVLETKQAGLLRAIISSDTFIEDRIQFDRQLLEDFYASRGYVDFRITGVNAELSQERDGYFVTFNVEEGQKFSFGEISVTSDLPEVDIDAFRRAVTVRTGKTYAPTLVDRDIERLERRAVEEGLDFVRVEPRVTRNDRDLTLDVEFVLTRGPRVFVERIDIEGNTTTLDRVVRRQFEIVEGDPFNPREIRNAAERIRALGYFADADVEAREGSSPQQVIVDVDVEEQPTGSISIGGSYSTSSGFGLNLSFAEQNFLGRGQQLSLGVTTTADTERYFFNFTEPALLGRDLALGLGLSYARTTEDDSDYNTEVARFSPSLTFPVSDNTRLQLSYDIESTDISIPDASEVGGIVRAEAGEGQILKSSLGYRLSYDTRRTGLNPDAGVLLEFGQDFGGVGGDVAFVETRARAVAQRLAFSEEITLRATVEAGALNYLGDDSSRVTDRFFMGSSVMRGFEPGGIGPREVGAGIDDALGGDYFAVARFEAEFPLGLPEEYGVSGGVFYDVGSLWGLSNSDDATGTVLYEDGSLRQVVGVSLFWDTPLGPLRFNFSDALQREDKDREQNFELTISTDF